MVSLTASEASDVGDMEAVPESAPAPSEAPKSRLSSGLTGAERVTSETIIRIGTTPEGEVVAKKQEIKPGTAFFMKRRPQENLKRLDESVSQTAKIAFDLTDQSGLLARSRRQGRRPGGNHRPSSHLLRRQSNRQCRR